MTDDTQADVFAPPRSNIEVREGPEVLWAMTWKEVRKLYLASVNIRALGFLYVLGAVGIIAASGVMSLAASGASTPPPAAFTALFIGLGALYIAACYTCFARPTWGRWLGIVLCVISLLSFPIGTIIGIMGLIAYAQGGRLFGADRISHKDVALVYKQRKKDKQ
jgi:hypothetical protein